MSIAENLKNIKNQIAEACKNSGRDTDSCSLVAVSKTKPANQILEAISAGQIDFGENYIQEASLKISEIETFKNAVRWHFIGTLQSNKVAQVAGRFALIHSVDRLSLAQTIAKESLKKNCVQDILMQINVGDESSKSGVNLARAPELFSQILEQKNLRICGLMCLPPLVEDFNEQRSYFRNLKEFMNKAREKLSHSQSLDFKILSMGTTHDFVAAIHEGATHVRIGTAIFGARDQ